MRGRRGVIDRDHGVFIFPDTHAAGLGPEAPARLQRALRRARALGAGRATRRTRSTSTSGTTTSTRPDAKRAVARRARLLTLAEPPPRARLAAADEITPMGIPRVPGHRVPQSPSGSPTGSRPPGRPRSPTPGRDTMAPSSSRRPRVAWPLIARRTSRPSRVTRPARRCSGRPGRPRPSRWPSGSTRPATSRGPSGPSGWPGRSSAPRPPGIPTGATRTTTTGSPRSSAWSPRRAWSRADELHRRKAEWEAAARATPHGKPIELHRGRGAGS